MVVLAFRGPPIKEPADIIDIRLLFAMVERVYGSRGAVLLQRLERDSQLAFPATQSSRAALFLVQAHRWEFDMMVRKLS